MIIDADVMGGVHVSLGDEAIEGTGWAFPTDAQRKLA